MKSELHFIGMIDGTPVTTPFNGGDITRINMISKSYYGDRLYHTYINAHISGVENGEKLRKLPMKTTIEFIGILYSYKNKTTDRWELCVHSDGFTVVGEVPQPIAPSIEPMSFVDVRGIDPSDLPF